MGKAHSYRSFRRLNSLLTVLQGSLNDLSCNRLIHPQDNVCLCHNRGCHLPQRKSREAIYHRCCPSSCRKRSPAEIIIIFIECRRPSHTHCDSPLVCREHYLKACAQRDLIKCCRVWEDGNRIPVHTAVLGIHRKDRNCIVADNASAVMDTSHFSISFPLYNQLVLCIAKAQGKRRNINTPAWKPDNNSAEHGFSWGRCNNRPGIWDADDCGWDCDGRLVYGTI